MNPTQGTGVTPLKKIIRGAPAVAQGVKEPGWPQLWRRLQLQLGFNPWPRNSHRPRMQPKNQTETITWRPASSRHPHYGKSKEPTWGRVTTAAGWGQEAPQIRLPLLGRVAPQEGGQSARREGGKEPTSMQWPCPENEPLLKRECACRGGHACRF